MQPLHYVCIIKNTDFIPVGEPAADYVIPAS